MAFGDLDGFGVDLLPEDFVREGALASAGGVVGGGLYAALADMVRVSPPEEMGLPEDDERKLPLFRTPLRRLGLAGGLGILGGRVLWELNEEMAKGHVGAMMGVAGQNLYELVMGKTSVIMKSDDEASMAAVTQAQLAGFGQLAGGFADAFVERQLPAGDFAELNGFGDPVVEDMNDDMAMISSVVGVVAG